MKDILLLFPPQWRPTQPYLSTPYLIAFLREKGFKVKQIDANSIAYSVLLSADMMGRSIEHISERKQKLEKKLFITEEEKQYHETLRLVTLQAENLLSDINKAKETLKDIKKFSKYYNFLKAINDIERALRVISASFYPTKITFNSFAMKYSWASINDILKAVNDEKENFFIKLFRDNLLGDVLADNPKLVGISIVDFTQIIPAFTIAKLIKNEAEHIKIVVGGNIFSHLEADSPQIKKIFDLIDFIIKFEGEKALSDLIEALEQSKGYKDVPNIIYKDKNGKIKGNEIKFIRDIDILPFPDFEDLHLDYYFSPIPIIPILSSRGCYWGKCAYCIHKFGYGNLYRPRKITKVVEELAYQKNKYNTNFFSFNDEMISPEKANMLSEEIIKEKLDVAWHMSARPEEGFTRDKLQTMHLAGCMTICWGVESYCQRLLDFMERGLKLQPLKEVLEASTQAGIWNSSFLFFGFPTETREEAQKTIDFIFNNRDLINSVGAGEFRLYRDSQVYHNPKKYGVSKIFIEKDQPFALWHEYEVKEGMLPSERFMILHTFIRSLKQQYKDFDFWHYMDREHMLIYLKNKWHLDSRKQMYQKRETLSKLESILKSEEYFKFCPRLINQLVFETSNNKQEKFIYNPYKGNSWLVNSLELSIIILCNGENTMNEIITKISKKYHISNDNCSEYVRKFVIGLIEKDLITAY